LAVGKCCAGTKGSCYFQVNRHRKKRKKEGRTLYHNPIKHLRTKDGKSESETLTLLPKKRKEKKRRVSFVGKGKKGKKITDISADTFYQDGVHRDETCLTLNEREEKTDPI